MPQEKGQSEKPQSWIDRLARKKVLDIIGTMKHENLTIVDGLPLASATSSCDVRTSSVDDKLKINVCDRALYRRMLFGGVLGAAESFMDGQWHVDDLTRLIRIMVRNIDSIRSLDFGWSGISRRLGRIGHSLRRNTVAGSRRNIHEHYDLGNEFFELFLDSTMNYSSGVFPSSQATMYEASVHKMSRICRKLNLQPDDHLLEIGTGWGGLAVHAARHFGCRVTTTTISREQFALAKKRVAIAGLQDRVQVLSKDYRDLAGEYDKLVSVEMIEAVGEQYYGQFFDTCNRLLANDGAMLLQAIIMNENDYPMHLRSIDFIRKYIFPGGCLPSVSALTDAARKHSRMRMLHLEDITEHYVRTLQCWHEAFADRLDEVRGMGFPESFIRKWIFYFCYCEAAFAERRTGSVQLMFAKPGCRIDPMSTLDGATLQSEWASGSDASCRQVTRGLTQPANGKRALPTKFADLQKHREETMR